MKLLYTAALTVCAVALIAQAPAPAPMTVQQILQRMAARNAGLSSFQVPVTIKARIKKGISLPVNMNGTRYFKAPDKEAMRMTSGVPGAAKAFQNTVANLGTPQTWPQTYNMTSVAPDTSGTSPTYALRAVYKKTDVKVDHIILNVDATTFDPVKAQWFYKNGATIVMNIQVKQVAGKYRLPATQTLDVKFPQYSGNATVTYGDYVINQPIADSVFTQQ